MTCKRCGWWKQFCHCDNGNGFYTTKDRLYYFTDYNTFGKPVVVHGKDHWNRLIKQHGLHDDHKQAHRQPQDFVKQKTTPYKRKEIAGDIWKELKEKGLNDKIRRRYG